MEHRTWNGMWTKHRYAILWSIFYPPLQKLAIFLFYSSKQSFNWLKWQNEKKYEDKLYILLRSSTGENPEPWNIIGLTENKRWKVPNPVHGSRVPSPRPQLKRGNDLKNQPNYPKDMWLAGRKIMSGTSTLEDGLVLDGLRRGVMIWKLHQMIPGACLSDW